MHTAGAEIDYLDWFFGCYKFSGIFFNRFCILLFPVVILSWVLKEFLVRNVFLIFLGCIGWAMLGLEGVCVLCVISRLVR